MPKLVQSELSLVGAFFFLVVPWMLLAYLGFLLFVRPPKKVLLTSLLGGVVLGVVNVLIDIAAYYAHWWHYTLKELILHVPLPFYLSPVFIFGSLAYMLIWHWWYKRRWLALVLLVAVPLFCIVRDIWGGLAHTSYQEWENTFPAIVATIGMWVAGFYGGFALFWRVAKHIVPANRQEETQESSQAG